MTTQHVLDRRRAHREKVGQLRGGERRAQALGISTDDLSQDLVHLNEKLHRKRKAYADLQAKLERMTTLWRAGGTWEEYEALEAERAAKRAEEWDGVHRPR